MYREALGQEPAYPTETDLTLAGLIGLVLTHNFGKLNKHQRTCLKEIARMSDHDLQEFVYCSDQLPSEIQFASCLSQAVELIKSKRIFGEERGKIIRGKIPKTPETELRMIITDREDFLTINTARSLLACAVLSIDLGSEIRIGGDTKDILDLSRPDLPELCLQMAINQLKNNF